MLPEGYARLKLLFVDDSLPTRVLLRETLRNTGLQQINIVDDATVAFHEIRANPPDLVFTDWQMPGRSGIELIRDIRRHPESPDPLLPVILLTANDDQKHVLQGRDAGASGYLIKPITIGRIVERVIEAVSRPRGFLVTRTYIGPDRRMQTPSSTDAMPAIPDAAGALIPPDHLLAAKVKGNPKALAVAMQQRAQAIATVRRIFGLAGALW